MTDESQIQGQPAGSDDTDTGEDTLTAALETTLDGLNRSIAKMEEIVQKIESGEPDWEENIKLLAEANELAETSSRRLDQVVQDVVYGESSDTDVDTPVGADVPGQPGGEAGAVTEAEMRVEPASDEGVMEDKDGDRETAESGEGAEEEPGA